MDANAKLTRTQDTWDGQPRYDVTVDGAVIGEVHRYTESNHHSVNNVLVHTTKRHGWRFELKVSAATRDALPTVELRQRVRRLACPRITWETRKRAVAELLRSREDVARLSA